MEDATTFDETSNITMLRGRPLQGATNVALIDESIAVQYNWLDKRARILGHEKCPAFVYRKFGLRMWGT